jgi:toxin ParE1/3/4
MTPLWSPEAVDDLAAIRDFIAEDNPAAARETVLRILDLVETVLTANPEIGRAGRVPGTRELVATGTPFVVPYRIVGTTIQILRVYHAARRWPEKF